MMKNKTGKPSNSARVMMLSLLFALLLLSGCQLAREYTPAAGTQEDIFVGFFVTMGDMGAFSIHEHFDEQGRIFAVREEGVPGYRAPFVFPVEGIPFFAGRYEHEGGVIHFGESGPGIISERGMRFYSTDEGSSTVLEGTLNVNPRHTHMVYSFHPVFQTPDLQVYIGLGGSSVSVARGGYFGEGPMQGFRQTHEVTVTENGVTRTTSTSVELGIAVMHTPERVVFIEMDAAHNVLQVREYAPHDVPAELVTLPQTVYVIMETHRCNSALHPVLRELIGAPDYRAAVFYEIENGVINRRFIQIVR